MQVIRNSLLSIPQSKSKKQKSVRWSKPTLSEASDALTELNSTEVKVCGICWKEEDDEVNSEVNWVACSQCEVWVHISCTSVSLWQDNDYICRCCSCEGK